MGQRLSLTVTLQLANASLPGLDTAAAQQGFSDVRLDYPPLPVSHRRGEHTPDRVLRAPGGTRTHTPKNLILSQARLPIPPLGRITHLCVTPLEF